MAEEDTKNEENEMVEETDNQKSEEKSNNMIILSAIIIIAITGGFFFFARSGRVQNLITNTQQQEMAVQVNSVVAENQKVGKTVVVATATFENAGYVVIHENNDGAPGGIIGVSELIEGSADNIEITLNRPADEGEALYAMLHTDDGNGEYNFPDSDGPTTDDDGNIVMAQFTIGVSEEDAIMEEDSMMEDASI